MAIIDPENAVPERGRAKGMSEHGENPRSNTPALLNKFAGVRKKMTDFGCQRGP
jgi:hypothetical protein